MAGCENAGNGASNGKMTDIHNATLFPQGTSAAAINASGQIVGLGRPADNSNHAFLYSNGAMVDLGSLPGATSTFAEDINDAGQIVGVSGPLGFLFSNGQMTALPLPSNAASIYELHINNNGQIAALINGSNFQHIGLFSNGAWTDLGAPAGSTRVLPTGINLSGQIVGVAVIPGNFSVRPRKPGRQFAMIHLNGTWVDLNTLIPANSGFNLIEANAINDSGQILCTAESSSSLNSTILLTPK